MTEREARTILLRAAEAGAFDEVANAWNRASATPDDLAAKLADVGNDWPKREGVWDDYLTSWASAIASAILGEAFEFPSWKAGWQAVVASREDPLWTTIMRDS